MNFEVNNLTKGMRDCDVECKTKANVRIDNNNINKDKDVMIDLNIYDCLKRNGNCKPKDFNMQFNGICSNSGLKVVSAKKDATGEIMNIKNSKSI